MRRLGILLSGRGSNFEAIAASIAEKRLDAEIAVVRSSSVMVSAESPTAA
mgnify:CR=1 FL=1